MFAQLYFYDTENELQNRMSCIYQDAKEIDEAIVHDFACHVRFP